MRRLFVMAAVIGMVPAAAQNGLTIVSGGKSAYTIVSGEAATPGEQRAAAELQRFLAEMSGVRLPIVSGGAAIRGPKLLVGDSAALRQLSLDLGLERLGPEGFVLRTQGADVVIAGGRPRGTMYGVTAFLERLGCRWFTAEVGRIPKRATIRIEPFNVSEKPAFEYREPFFWEAFEKEWAARNRTNGAHSKLDASTGGKLQYYPFVHTFYQLVPPEKHFEAHPEYFSLIDGKRRVERGQLCLTNPDVLRIATAQVEAWIREHPEATLYSVSQNDWEGWCECDRCRRVETEEGGKHMGPVLRFVNAVAEKVEAGHPDKLIDTLAYWYTEDPPARVRPRKNVRIRLCPIGICTGHSFLSCPRSAYFARNLKAWSAITDQLYIWHYNTNFSHYLLPFPDFDELAADVPAYRDHGVVGLFMQGSFEAGGGGEMAELRSYVLARLLWNPAVDVKATVAEFLEGVYGKAAPAMQAYFDRLHREVRPGAGGGRHLWIYNVPDYSADLLREGFALLDKAQRLTQDEPTRRRIQKDRLSLEYLALMGARQREVRGGVYAPASVDGLRKQGTEFLARVRSAGIERLHEARDLKLDDAYYASVREHPVVILENTAWRAVVVPDLNARVIHLVEKATGQEVLRQPPPGDAGYPDMGGIVAGFYPDEYSSAWMLKFRLVSASATEVRLEADGPGGALARRSYVLTNDGLTARAEVVNRGGAKLNAAVQLRADLEPKDIDAARVTFRTVAGTAVDRRLIVVAEPPTGRAMWEGGEIPAGTWRVEPAGVVSRFAGVRRASLTWSAKSRPVVTLAGWSEEKALAPGEALTVEATYGR